MQVTQSGKFDGPSQLNLTEQPLRQADANTAVVRIGAASVNRSDVATAFRHHFYATIMEEINVHS
jgi:NADPH:quinone reductase-like Zn-dependent oxidoreductase